MSKSKRDTPPILEDQLGLGEAGESDAPGAAENTSGESEVSAESSESELAPPAKKPMTELRPWYRRPKLWAKIVGVFALLVVIGFGGMAWYNRTQDTQAVKSRWLTLSQAAERATSEASRSSYDSFDPAYQALADMNDKVAEIQRANRASFLGNGKLVDSFADLLESMKSYTDKAKSEASDLSRLTSSDLDGLKSTATGAKIAVDEFRKSSKVTDGADIPEEFYLLNERFDRLIKAHNDAEAGKKAEADAALSKEEQAKQDKADAEEAASRWTQAYITGSVADMKKYMTAAYTKEYDFTQVTASWRATNYPKSYRRVSTDKKSESYEVVETVSFVTKSDYTADGSYTSTYVFIITQDATSKKWLINSQRYQ